MTAYFVDIQSFYGNENMQIKELCIMNANDILNPYHKVFVMDIPWNLLPPNTAKSNTYLASGYHQLSWDEGSSKFCQRCILNDCDYDIKKSIIYVLDQEDGTKMKTLKKYFPELRFTSYNKNKSDLSSVPPNITCIWREHGPHCAYKQCLLMCTDYCKCYS